MSLSRIPLQIFLSTARRSLFSEILSNTTSTPISLVLGNESADIDSFASSLLYAYLSPHPSIPLLSIPRSDLPLRPELLHVLSTLQLQPTDVLCLDDAPLTSLPTKTPLVLVDQNTRPSTIPSFPVTAIVDHHDDEHQFPTADPRIVEKSGSCASLITNYFKARFSEDVDGGDVEKLALAAIFIDTADMTQRVTTHDEEAVSFLLSRLSSAVSATAQSWDRKRFFEGIFAARQNVADMSVRDLLRKDYKEYSEHTASSEKRLGIAAVVLPLHDLVEKPDLPGFVDAVKAWGEERGLDVVSVMTTVGKGENFKRQIMVWALNEGDMGCLKLFEKRAEERGLGLVSWGGGRLDGLGRKAWAQRDLTASRKLVAPMLRECLRDSR
ncbi:Exopolyphosphatase [Rhizina undulata]